MSFVGGVMVTWLTTTSGVQTSQASSPSTQTVTPGKPDKPLRSLVLTSSGRRSKIHIPLYGSFQQSVEDGSEAKLRGDLPVLVGGIGFSVGFNKRHSFHDFHRSIQHCQVRCRKRVVLRHLGNPHSHVVEEFGENIQKLLSSH
jgi:hypothetical protein